MTRIPLGRRLMFSPIQDLATPVSQQPVIFPSPPPAAEVRHPLVRLGRLLRDEGYRFVTITPATHRRVVARPSPGRATLSDIFGWSRRFVEDDLPAPMLDALREAHALVGSANALRSAVRFSTLDQQIFAHSAFPTDQADAVFFGPDTYRFAHATRHLIDQWRPRSGLRVLDLGAGSGAGGLHAAALLHAASPQIVLADINAHALRFSRINAELNQVPHVDVVESNLYAGLDGAFDLIISNPPYLVDPLARTYRHGGGAFGAALSIEIAVQGVERLVPGGLLLLYTGSAIADGRDALHETLRARLAALPVRFSYEEIDPDVFGEELDAPPYDQVDRIAVVAAKIERMGASR
jgi:methylase of polypeptide subunit release factors